MMMDNSLEGESLQKVDIDLMDLSEMGRESILLKSSSETAADSSTAKGLCVKEYEEKMDNLKKENFNLKLRLYFLEGKNGAFPEGTEALHKEIIDLKIENETLMKDLKERQDLLLHASKALEMVEDEKKIDNDNAEKLIDDLHKRIDSLEEENIALQQAKQESNKSHFGNDTGYADFLGAVDLKDVETQKKNLELSEQLNSMTHEIENYKEIKEQFETDNSRLKYEVDELKDQLTRANAQTAEFERKLKMFQEMFDERGRDILFLQDQSNRLFRTNKRLNEKLEELEYSKFELSIQVQDFQENAESIETLKEELAEYKEKWASTQCDLIDANRKYDETEVERKKTISLLKKSLQKTNAAEENVMKLEQIIKEQRSGLEKGDAKDVSEGEVRALKEELAKTQQKLEMVTSAQLAEKNKEIDRLTSMINNMKIDRQSTVPELPRLSFDYIFESFNDLKFQQAMEMKKQSQQKITQLINELIRLANSKTQNHVEQIKKEMRVVIEKQLITDSAMNQCFELCSYTLDHLHELAVFLSALLQNKDIRESLSEHSVLNIRNILEKSIEISQRHSIDTRLSSLPDISNLDILVQNARASIANIRDLQQAVAKVDKSINAAVECEKCVELKRKLGSSLEEYEQLKRVNQVLEDEIDEGKQQVAIRDEQIDQMKKEINSIKDSEDEFNILLDEYQQTIQSLQVDKINLESKLNSSEAKLRRSQLVETELEDRIKKISDDICVNWISKEQYDEAENKHHEEVVNCEAQIAAIKMELDEVRGAAAANVNIDSEFEDKENIVIENYHTASGEKLHAISRRTIEISDDRKVLLMATETSMTTAQSTSICSSCPKYQNQIRELKKYLGRAVEKLEKQSKQKSIVDSHIQKQLTKTESFLQQAKFNMENICKKKENVNSE